MNTTTALESADAYTVMFARGIEFAGLASTYRDALVTARDDAALSDTRFCLDQLLKSLAVWEQARDAFRAEGAA